MTQCSPYINSNYQSVPFRHPLQLQNSIQLIKLLQQFICVSYQFNHGYTMHEYRVYNSIINNVHSFLYIPAICNLHTHIMCARIIQPPVSHVFFKPPEMFLKSPEFGWLPNLCIPV